jgi:hypothetical protein
MAPRTDEGVNSIGPSDVQLNPELAVGLLVHEEWNVHANVPDPPPGVPRTPALRI